jgi:hypothetical protein
LLQQFREAAGARVDDFIGQALQKERLHSVEVGGEAAAVLQPEVPLDAAVHEDVLKGRPEQRASRRAHRAWNKLQAYINTTRRLVSTPACWLGTTFSYLQRVTARARDGRQQHYRFPMIGSNDSKTFLGIWHSSTLGV